MRLRALLGMLQPSRLSSAMCGLTGPLWSQIKSNLQHRDLDTCLFLLALAFRHPVIRSKT